MNTKILAIILILGVLILAAGSAYSGRGPKGSMFEPTSAIDAHPWEGSKNTSSGSGGSGIPSLPSVASNYNEVIAIPFFSDFTVLICVQKITKKGNDPGSSIKFKGKSYQIIFTR
jgi:hypothetical protein